MRELSGGNQQKVVIGRWLLREPEVFLFDEPTRGIDVAAKFAIYHLIDDLAARGKGIVVASSEVEELMLLCDRIAVMSAGRLVEMFERGEWSQERLLAAASRGTRKCGRARGKVVSVSVLIVDRPPTLPSPTGGGKTASTLRSRSSVLIPSPLVGRVGWGE